MQFFQSRSSCVTQHQVEGLQAIGGQILDFLSGAKPAQSYGRVEIVKNALRKRSFEYKIGGRSRVGAVGSHYGAVGILKRSTCAGCDLFPGRIQDQIVVIAAVQIPVQRVIRNIALEEFYFMPLTGKGAA